MSKDGDDVVLEQERRRWEEMDVDCLANAFNRAGMESLLLALPFVCKSWYIASLNPICWACLSFPDYIPSPLLVNTVEEIEMGPQSFGSFYDKFVDEYGIDKSRFSTTAFVKLVVDRSKGKATQLELSMYSTGAALRYVSDACPLLKHLTFGDDLVIFKHSRILPEVIGKWKFLVGLSLRHSFMVNDQQGRRGKYLSRYFRELLAFPSCFDVFERIVAQIGTHCKHFKQLTLMKTRLHRDEALTIVNFLPHLQTIFVTGCIIKRDSILTIVRGCKELQVFYAKECTGFEEGGEELYKLARQTGKLVCEDCVRRDERLILGVLSTTLMRQSVYNKLCAYMLGQ